MTASLREDCPPSGAGVAIDVRTTDELLASSVQRLERITAWFEDSLSHVEERPT